MSIKRILIDDCPLLASDGNPCILGIGHKLLKLPTKWGRKCESHEQLLKYIKSIKNEYKEWG